MSDHDHFVRNAVEHLIDDLDSVERYALLTEAEQTAVLLWVLEWRIRMDGIGGWIETHGERSEAALAALSKLGATEHAAAFKTAIELIPTTTADNPDERLSAMDSWTADEAGTWRRAEDEYLALIGQHDLIDNYLRPFIGAHPADFQRR